jgi:NADP-dependent 3-hydroxy acid dehydrogenase YdfG
MIQLLSPVTPLPANLSAKADLAKVETTLRDDQTITMLINNAGIGFIAPLLKADIEKMDDMIDLNTIALTRLTYAAAPAFVARRASCVMRHVARRQGRCSAGRARPGRPREGRDRSRARTLAKNSEQITTEENS